MAELRKSMPNFVCWSFEIEDVLHGDSDGIAHSPDLVDAEIPTNGAIKYPAEFGVIETCSVFGNQLSANVGAKHVGCEPGNPMILHVEGKIVFKPRGDFVSRRKCVSNPPISPTCPSGATHFLAFSMNESLGNKGCRVLRLLSCIIFRLSAVMITLSPTLYLIGIGMFVSPFLRLFV